MANLAYVSYAIEGSKEDLQKLDKLFKWAFTFGQELRVDYGYPMDRIIEKMADELNITDREHWEWRGVIEDSTYVLDEENSVLYFNCANAWCNNETFERLIEQYAPSAKIYYYCDADDGFDTNDEDCKYFGYDYKIDYSLEDDADIETFKSLTELIERCNELLHTDCQTFEELKKVIGDYEDDEYYINLYY